MDPRYATAAAAAAAAQANLGNSPNGNSADVQHLQNLAQIQFGAGASSLAAGALGGGAKNAADVADAQRQAAEKTAEIENKRKAIQDEAKQKYEAYLTDPKNFKREVSQDGGYNFYDPTGKPITVNDYAKVTNQRIPEVLKDSKNQSDMNFVNDYKTTLELGKLMTANDSKGLQKFYDKNPGIKDYIDNNNIKTYSDFVNNFRSAYSDKFTQAEAQGMANKDTPIIKPSGGGAYQWLANLFGG